MTAKIRKNEETIKIMYEFDINETMESMRISELQVQMEQFRLQAYAAEAAGNPEKASYLQGELAKLDTQLRQLEGM